jgi:hypothetical protein
MNAILRRLDRIEQSLAPKATAQDRRMAEIADLIRERRRQRLQAAGLPFQEPPPFPPDYHGRRLSIAETIRARREERLMDAAAHQTRNT